MIIVVDLNLLRYEDKVVFVFNFFDYLRKTAPATK